MDKLLSVKESNGEVALATAGVKVPYRHPPRKIKSQKSASTKVHLPKLKCVAIRLETTQTLVNKVNFVHNFS